MEDYESILLIKPEVFVFRIPPRTTNRGYRAADWNLQTPDWTGRMRLVCKGNEVTMKLEDKNTGELFAKCPIDKYPGIAVEAVADSSRYFVLRIQDDGAGRSAFIGFGFADRGDSFDLNVALQDHFKWIEKTEKIQEEEKDDSKPRLDLSFKEGETIKINIGQKSGTNRPKPKGSTGGGFGILPPPPGSNNKIPPPPIKNINPTDSGSALPTNDIQAPKESSTGNFDLLLDIGMGGSAPAPVQEKSNDFWNDFAAAGSANNTNNTTSQAESNPQSVSNNSWVQF